MGLEFLKMAKLSLEEELAGREKVLSVLQEKEEQQA